MPDGVLTGAAPLTRAQGAGGIAGQMDYIEQRFGPKVRLASFGGKRPKFFEDVIDYYVDLIKTPIVTLSDDFKSYFKFMKESREADIKEKKGGILKQLHSFAPHFFDFKVWKKLTGLARKPEVAALHQIRDILIQAYDLDKDVFGRDPRDLITEVFNQYRFFRMKLSPEEAGPSGFFKTIKGFFKETIQETREENQRFYIKRFDPSLQKKSSNLMLDYVKGIHDAVTSKNTISVNVTKNESRTAKDISDHLKLTEEQIEIDKEQAAQAKFGKFVKGKDEKGEKTWLGKILKRLLGIGVLTALAYGIFGKKGAIAVAALGFFTKILPSMLWQGMKGLFSFATRSIGRLGKFALNIIKNPKAALTMLKGAATKAGTAATTIGGAAAGGAAFAGLTVHDLLKKGGGMEAFKAGEVGKGVARTALGGDMAEATTKEVAQNVAKQALKYAGLGGLIGSIVPGVGTAIGAGIGAAVGGIGATMKALWEKGIIQKAFAMVKKNKLGAMLGGVLGSFAAPGVGTILGLLGGAWAQDKLRDPRIREKMLEAMKTAWNKFKDIGKMIATNIKDFGKWVGKKIMDISAFPINIIKGVLKDPKKALAKMGDLKTKAWSSIKDMFRAFFDFLPTIPGKLKTWLGITSKTQKELAIEDAEKAKRIAEKKEREKQESLTKRNEDLMKSKEDLQKELEAAERLKLGVLSVQNAMLDGILTMKDVLEKKNMSVVQSSDSKRKDGILKEVG